MDLPLRGGYPIRRRLPPAFRRRRGPARSSCVAVARLSGGSRPYAGLFVSASSSVGWRLPACVAFAFVRRRSNHHLTKANASRSGNRHPGGDHRNPLGAASSRWALPSTAQPRREPPEATEQPTRNTHGAAPDSPARIPAPTPGAFRRPFLPHPAPPAPARAAPPAPRRPTRSRPTSGSPKGPDPPHLSTAGATVGPEMKFHEELLRSP